MLVRPTTIFLSSTIVRKVEDTCPIATQDLQINLKNRQNAIDNVGYGPLNPSEPNDDFWADKANRWDIAPEEAKTALCGNCVFFVRTPRMLDCISAGLGDAEDAEAIIDGGELGYCEALDFKCAAKRTCNAWAVGGPITLEKHGTHDQSAHGRGRGAGGRGAGSSAAITSDSYSKDYVQQKATEIALDKAGQARLDMQRYKVGTQEQENATVDFEMYRAASEGMRMSPPARMTVPTGIKGKAYVAASDKGGKAQSDTQRYKVGSQEHLDATIDSQLFTAAVNYLGQG